MTPKRLYLNHNIEVIIMKLSIESKANRVRSLITSLSAEEFSPCELLAEVVAQALMSDDCDPCHAHWLELHALIGDKIEGMSE